MKRWARAVEMALVWVGGALFAATMAFAEGCPADRTPLEMAGHTLCLPTEAMPSTIRKDENDGVMYLNWDAHGLSAPLPAPLPPGVFEVFIDASDFRVPSDDMTRPSAWPNMRMSPEGDMSQGRIAWRYPQGIKINGKPFELRCTKSLNPENAKRGGQSCQIFAWLADGLRLHIHFGTVSRRGAPAWPELDERWAETWPPYLAQLESGINNLLSIQEGQ